MLRLLVYTTLFPHAGDPAHGVFVENRLRALLAGGGVTARVVAPVPWFPSARPIFGRWAAFAGVPPVEERGGLVVRHPRYPVLPRIGMVVAPALLAAATALPVAELVKHESADLIDAHYLYPDGVAAVMLAQSLGLPVVLTARGTDVNLIPRNRLARAWIGWAARRADALVAVCRALKDEMVGLGIAADKIRVLRNGVDLDRYRPGDRAAARAALGVSGPVLLSVGHLIERKGHDLVIAALPQLPSCTLLIAGAGPELERLQGLARRLGVVGRVRFLGRLPPERLPQLYRAADALVLASSREGWANVLLEAMACGTPVVASNVWGTAEVVAAPAAGLLMPSRDAAGVAAGVRRLLADPPGRDHTRRYAEGFGWEDTSAGQRDLFEGVLAARAEARGRLAAG